MKRGPIVHGILLVAVLIFGYQTWTRDKTVGPNLLRRFVRADLERRSTATRIGGDGHPVSYGRQVGGSHAAVLGRKGHGSVVVHRSLLLLGTHGDQGAVTAPK